MTASADSPRPPMTTLISLWAPVLAYMAMLFGLSSMQTLPPRPGAMTDYHLHFAAYAGLAAVTVRALAGGRWQQVTWLVACGAAAISAVYGVTDEYHQLFVPGRTFEIPDLLADAAGSVLGATVVWACGILTGVRRQT